MYRKGVNPRRTWPRGDRKPNRKVWGVGLKVLKTSFHPVVNLGMDHQISIRRGGWDRRQENAWFDSQSILCRERLRPHSWFEGIGLRQVHRSCGDPWWGQVRSFFRGWNNEELRKWWSFVVKGKTSSLFPKFPLGLVSFLFFRHTVRTNTQS